MSRYDKETLRAKIEWEGADGITWFKPHEVPEHMQDLWADALGAKKIYEDLLDLIYEELEVE